MTDHSQVNIVLEHQLSHYLVNIGKVPVTQEVRAVAARLQTLLDERQPLNKA